MMTAQGECCTLSSNMFQINHPALLKSCRYSPSTQQAPQEAEVKVETRDGKIGVSCVDYFFLDSASLVA